MTGAKLFLVPLMLVWVIFLSCGDKTNTTRMAKEVHFDALDQELKAAFAKNELLGMSVILIANGDIAWQGSYGYAHDSLQIPITKNTMYRVASISKTITTIALMQLWEAGKVDLDTDVTNYLDWTLKHPKHPDRPITLRHLMSHQSGIRDGEGYGNFSKAMIAEKLDIRALFSVDGRYYTEDLFAAHAPGDYFSYTNCTWGLVVSIIEKISGQRFDDYCREHIFIPMGVQADFNASSIAQIDSLAVLYRYREGSWVPQADDYKGVVPLSRAYEGYQLGRNGLLFGPQGSLRSSAIDLAKFAMLFLKDGLYNGNQILQPGTVDFMLDSQWRWDGSNGDTWENFFLSYGLGVHLTVNKEGGDIIFPDREMVGHPGIAYGLLSDMYFEKDRNSGIVFITNGSKQPFEYGEHTSFYQVEEDVFGVVYPYLKQLGHLPNSKQE